MTVTEVIHPFGAGDGLFGIVTLPPEPLRAASEARPFAVILNSGLVHRVGPFRTGVELARTLAARGVRVLRYDRSGLGDSRPRPDARPLEEQVVADGRAALDSLAARYGARRFVVGGLCAGAMNAHRVAAADARVTAAWLLDGYAYPTRRYYRERLVRQLRTSTVRELAEWATARVEKRLRALRGGAPPPPPPEPTPAGEPAGNLFAGWPPREAIRHELEQMLHRGVRFLFMYTGGWSGFVHPRQFDEMFPQLPHRGQIAVEYAPRADHTYLAQEDRAVMLRTVGAFASGLP